MTENFEEISSERLREIAATEQIWNNELRKYVASALDRLSTALIVVGILAPIVGIMANPSVLQQDNTFWLMMKFIAMVFGGVLSFGLHICGRWVLKEGCPDAHL